MLVRQAINNSVSTDVFEDVLAVVLTDQLLNSFLLLFVFLHVDLLTAGHAQYFNFYLGLFGFLFQLPLYPLPGISLERVLVNIFAENLLEDTCLT